MFTSIYEQLGAFLICVALIEILEVPGDRVGSACT